MSTTLPSFFISHDFPACPPFMSTYAGPSWWMYFAAFSASEGVFIFIPEIYSASGTFGVTTRDRGNNFEVRALTASADNNLFLFLDIMTGSTTTCLMLCSLIFRLTTSTMPLFSNIPVLTASVPMSVTMASIC